MTETSCSVPANRLQLVMPDGSTASGHKVLVHACCAPCSSAIIECMLYNGMLPTVYFCNPNIFPFDEYQVRKEELKRFLKANSIPFSEDTYDHEAWLNDIHGWEKEPERGKRCLQCFLFRLKRTAAFASANGFQWFTTTLSSSRWKDMAQISEAGRRAASAFQGISFWEHNWRKGGLQQRRAELLREYQFYNQLYCGCEFSQASMSHKQNQQQ